MKDSTIAVVGALVIFALLLGGLFGYRVGFNSAAKDCEKLGAFYVNSAVYTCEVKK